MNIKVYQNRETHQIDNDVYGTQNENNVTELKIEVPEQYKTWNKRIVFLTEEGTFWDVILNNTYTIKNNITKYEEVEAYIWLTENAENEQESINDFRSKTFRLSFFANENADNLVPDEKQIDGFNSMLTVLNAEIEEVKQINTDFTKLKREVEQAEEERIQNEKARQESETSRATAESIRKKNESDRIINENDRVEAENNRSSAEETRKTNETERIANESARKLAEKNREKTTKEAVNNIKDLSASYEQLAEEKKTELNNYTTNLETSLKNKLDTYEEVKEEELDIHKTTLETEMTNTKDTLVQGIKTAQNGFDENVTAKTNEFNENAIEKTNIFNTNASTKQTEYDNNATSKLEEYNSNSTAKVNEFNENAESYEKRIADLEQERDEIAEQMPWKTTNTQESIHIEDSAKYSRNKLDIFGNLNQETREGYNKLNVLEENSAGTTKTVNGVTYTFNEDGTISLNGTATSNVYINLNTNLNIAKGGSILTKILKGTVTGNITLAIYDENLENNVRNNLASENTSILSTDIVYCKCRLVVFKGAVVNNLVLGNMILDNTVQQSKTEIEYEQYGAMPSLEYPSMPITATGVQKITKLGKNLCNSINQNYFLYKNCKTCGFNINDNGLIIDVEKGQNYTISTLVIQERYRIACLNDIPTDSKEVNAYNGINQDNTDNSITINTTGYKYLVVNATDLTSIQIEKGTNATEYEPYKEETFTLDLGTTELCKIVDKKGNVVAQDRAVYREVDGVWKWQWEKNVGKIILNGTENWIFHLEKELTYVFKIYNFFSEDVKNILVSDRFPNDVPGDVEKIIKTANTLYIAIYKTRLSTLEEFKSLLANNNITVYCATTKSKHEDCTESQSATLDKLHKLALEKGINNIIVESENGVTTELQLEYMQDNNLIKEQEHKALEDRITALEELLSTTQTSAMLLDNMQSDLESEV